VAYDANFLPGRTIDLPTLLPAVAADAWNDGTPIDHTHHSVGISRERALAIYSATNVDGEHIVGSIPRRDFTFDPDVPRQIQIDDDRGYKGFPTPDANPWDRGHLARRVDVHWPTREIALLAERDAAFWTNISPQHRRLNQGPWGDVEDWLLDLAEGQRRMSVFTGPVFTSTDLVWRNRDDELEIRIPAGYWKIGLFNHDGRLRAAAFLIWQTDVVASVDDFDPDTFDPVLEQVRVTTIEHLAGLSFGDTVRLADPLHFGADVETGTRGPTLIEGRARVEAQPAGPRATSITVAGPGDLVV